MELPLKQPSHLHSVQYQVFEIDPGVFGAGVGLAIHDDAKGVSAWLQVELAPKPFTAAVTIVVVAINLLHRLSIQVEVRSAPVGIEASHEHGSRALKGDNGFGSGSF